MPINQINTSNTFFHWLTATQALIDKYNYFEIASNTVLTTANIVYATSNNLNALANIVNSNTILVVSLSHDVNNKSASVNAQTAFVLSTSTNLMAYVNVAYATGNAVSNTVNSAFVKVNSAFTHANSGFNHANGAFITANGAFVKANAGYTHVNSAFNHANGAYSQANTSFIRANGAFDQANSATTYANNAYLTSNNAYDRVNTILQLANTANLVVIRDDRNTTTQYVVLTPNTSGLFTSANVSSGYLKFNPSTGFLYTNLNSYIVNTGTLLVSNTGMVVGLNSEMLGGLTSSQFLRSDANTVLTKMLVLTPTIATSNSYGALWANGTQGALLFDSSAQKRIAWNGGSGQFTIEAGTIYSPTLLTEVYNNEANGGAVLIRCSHDTSNGYISIFTANSGVPGTPITWNNEFQVGPAANYVAVNNKKLWHEGNDGSGSGLDADIVDGLHGSQFLRSDANTTLNTMLVLTNSIASSNEYGCLWANGNSGALLFDDQAQKRLTWNDGSIQFGLKAGYRYFKSADRYIVTGDGAARILMGSDAANGDVIISTANIGTQNAAITWANHFEVTSTPLLCTINGFKVWHQGNDGSGSDLDADLLDGQHGSYFAPINNPYFTGEVKANNIVLTRKGLNREGGEIVFEKPTSNTGLSGNVVMDIYGNTLRVFDSVSTRGFSANIAAMANNGGTTFQETLISGTSIKTLNGEDLLGAGDIQLVPSKTVNTVNSNWQANVNYTYIITQPITLTLPLSANAGDEIAIVNLSTGTPVLNRNGKNIMGVSEDMDIDVSNTGFTLIYSNSSGWVIV